MERSISEIVLFDNSNLEITGRLTIVNLSIRRSAEFMCEENVSVDSRS